MRKFIANHPAVFFSSLFIFISFLGLYHQFVILNAFSINLANYADIDDFLVSSINIFYIVRYFYKFDFSVFWIAFVYPIFWVFVMSVVRLYYESSDIFIKKIKYKESPIRYFLFSIKYASVTDVFYYIIFICISTNLMAICFLIGNLAYFQSVDIKTLKEVDFTDEKCDLNVFISKGPNIEKLVDVRLIAALNSVHFFYDPRWRLNDEVNGLKDNIVVPANSILKIEYCYKRNDKN